jgi:hypothetical protein
MSELLAERCVINAAHEIRIVNPRLQPGQTVQVFVRTIDAAKASKPSFLKTAQTLSLATPQDYSVSFEQALQATP